MALSDYERKMLEALEAQLKGEDPTFATAMDTKPGVDTRTALSPRHLVLGLIVAMLGIGIVVAAMTWEVALVGVAGVVVVWLGFMYIMKGTSKVEVAASEQRAKPSAQSFMDKQAEAFRKRRDEGMN